MTSRSLFFITCNIDRWQTELLVKSISAFVLPCNIEVLIHEYDTDDWFAWWERYCAPHLADFEVSIYTVADVFPDPVMWDDKWEVAMSYQLCKMLHSLRCESDEYINLDPKNWFVGACNIDNLPRMTVKPWSSISHWATPFYEFTELLAQGWGSTWDRTQPIRLDNTPYIYPTQITQDFCLWHGGTDGLQEVYRHIIESNPHTHYMDMLPIEVWMIDHNCYNASSTDVEWNHNTLWTRNALSFTGILKHLTRNYTPVVGIHRVALSEISQPEMWLLLDSLRCNLLWPDSDWQIDSTYHNPKPGWQYDLAT